jgi:phi LC3 family holin
MKIDFKNKTFWISLASIIVLMIQNIGELFGFSVASDDIMAIINSVCGVLIVLGILNNPTKKTDTVAESGTEQVAESVVEQTSNSAVSTTNDSDQTQNK